MNDLGRGRRWRRGRWRLRRLRRRRWRRALELGFAAATAICEVKGAKNLAKMNIQYIQYIQYILSDGYL